MAKNIIKNFSFKRNSTEFENSDCKKGSDFMVGWKALTDEEKKVIFMIFTINFG